MSRKMSLIGSVAFKIFLCTGPYVVISVLNAFQIAIVMRSIQYLRLTVYAFEQ